MISNPNASPQRRGASTSTATINVGVTTLVTAGANTTGLVLRTAILSAVAGGLIQVTIGGQPVVAAISGGFFNYTGPGLLVPPGSALAVEAVTANGSAYIVSWDAV